MTMTTTTPRFLAALIAMVAVSPACTNDLRVGELDESNLGGAPGDQESHPRGAPKSESDSGDAQDFRPSEGGEGGEGGEGDQQGVDQAGATSREMTLVDGDSSLMVTIESLGYRAAQAKENEEPWVVNTMVHGTREGDVFVSGYVSGWGSDDTEGFVDRLVDGALQPVVEPGWTNGLWVASAEVQYACGYTQVWRIEAGETEVVYSAGKDAVLQEVWGTGLDSIVVVGFDGAIIEYDGADWIEVESGVRSHLRAVWGTDPGNLFAVGHGGVILHRVDGVWTRMDSGTTIDLTDIWGSGPDDVYAVGGSEADPGHIILHYDGSQWRTMSEGGSRRSVLLGVTGTSRSEVYAVGAYRAEEPHALIYRYTGDQWTEIPIDVETFLWDVWCVGAGDCYVVGPDDTVLHVTVAES